MTEVLMSGQIAERLQTAATERGVAVSDLVAQALDLYLAAVPSPHEPPAESHKQTSAWEKQAEEIAQEQAAYESQHSDLYKEYAGQFIAMQNGNVVDHDHDRVALSRRIRVRYGKQSVLITPVLPEPSRIFRSSRPRLSRN